MAEYLQDNLRVFVVPVDIMEIPNLDIYEQMVYIVLRSFSNAREATAFPSYNTIAKLGRMSRRKAINCVTTLVEKGLLKKEVRLDVTKNRKIRNTSNLYTIESPKIVHNMHQGSAQHAPRVVHSMHRGSAQHAPENNHLTKPIRTKPINNNKDDVVVNISIKNLLKDHGIEINDVTLKRWIKIENEENILKIIKETLKRKDVSNVVGYITKILETGFVPSKPFQPTLPSYIRNQDSSSPAITIDIKQKREVLELLFQLGEITEQEYNKKIQEL